MRVSWTFACTCHGDRARYCFRNSSVGAGGCGFTVRVTFGLRFLAGEIVTTRHDFPLPDPPASVEAAGGFNYPNSNGFQYEADAIHKCIREGRTSCDLYTTSEMMAVRLNMSEGEYHFG